MAHGAGSCRRVAPPRTSPRRTGALAAARRWSCHPAGCSTTAVAHPTNYAVRVDRSLSTVHHPLSTSWCFLAFCRRTQVRNFKRLKCFPSRPTRSCLNSTPGPISNREANAHARSIGLSETTAVPLATISNSRLHFQLDSVQLRVPKAHNGDGSNRVQRPVLACDLVESRDHERFTVSPKPQNPKTPKPRVQLLIIMNFWVFTLILALALCKPKTVEDEIKDLDFSNIHFLNDDTFEDEVKGDVGTEEDWAIFFFNPTCNHCRKFIIEWVKVANTFANSTEGEYPILGAVDCMGSGEYTCD